MKRVNRGKIVINSIHERGDKKLFSALWSRQLKVNIYGLLIGMGNKIINRILKITRNEHCVNKERGCWLCYIYFVLHAVIIIINSGIE